MGTYWGHSYFTFCQAVLEAGLSTRCHAADTWQGDPQAGHYGEVVYQQVGRENERYRKFSTPHRQMFDQAVENFEPGSIDLLHIDGLHTYGAVRHDFETWLPKLSSRAVVLFHDTRARSADFGVWKFLSEITQPYPAHLEFTHSSGLGVLSLDTGGAPEWLQPAFPLKNDFCQFFQVQGHHLERVRSAEKHRNHLIRKIESLHKSWSWRLTAPLRSPQLFVV